MPDNRLIEPESGLLKGISIALPDFQQFLAFQQSIFLLLFTTPALVLNRWEDSGISLKWHHKMVALTLFVVPTDQLFPLRNPGVLAKFHPAHPEWVSHVGTFV
jgi:hypothetical protein